MSCGNTELFVMKNHLDFDVIGQTQDDAIGEPFDKVARVVNLPYPGGVYIDRESKKGSNVYKLPTPHTEGEFDYSFSGLKTAVINLATKERNNHRELNVQDLACSFQSTAIDYLLDKALPAIKKFNVKQVVLAGGVSANSYLRSEIKRRLEKEPVEVVIPPIWCTTDNAAMIAKVGSYLYKEEVFADLSLSADPSWEIENFRNFGAKI